jgi:hypothetical protein
MTRQLVFVHGRAQQHKDAAALKAEWIAAWEAGLEKSGLKLPISEQDIRFPYYGQTLFDLVEGEPGQQPAEVVVKGGVANPSQRDFMQAVFDEIRNKAKIHDATVTSVAGADVVTKGILNWGWVQAILEAVDRYVPFGSGTSIALFTNDVYQYLTNIGIRDKIDTGVRQALQAGLPTVVVGHSLGSVVAYSLLRRDGKAQGWKVPLFVTVGSPLAVTAIRNGLRPIGHPECAEKWFNALDTRDVVALYALDKRHFGINPGVENFDGVRNHTDNRHGIGGYLDDKVVAKRIYDALVG